MKKKNQTILICSLLLFIVSCKGQIEKTPIAKAPNSNQTATPTEKETSDFDPYFTPTEKITSPYGPTNITRNIMQDKKGNIWLATWEGIIQYDGTTFTNFTNKKNLRRFHVFSVLEEKSGNLWFGTIDGGLYRYDGFFFRNFTAKEGLASDRVGCFYEDESGKIWIGTDGGISVYDGKSFTNFTREEGMTNNDVNTIIQDKKGRFWIGTRGSACWYDGESFSECKTITGKTFNNVRCIIQDSKGHIWLGGNDGLWRYNGVSFSQIETNFVGYIYEDSKGNIWTSSEVAENRAQWMLSRYDEKTLLEMNPKKSVVRKEENMFCGIMEDAEGGIWFGSLDGACRVDGGGAVDCFREE